MQRRTARILGAGNHWPASMPRLVPGVARRAGSPSRRRRQLSLVIALLLVVLLGLGAPGLPGALRPAPAAAAGGLTVTIPTSQTAQPRLYLQWTPDTSVNGYEIRRDSATGALVASLARTSWYYTDANLLEYTQYCYVVVGLTSAGPSPSATVCATTLVNPPTVAGLSGRTPSSFTVSWTDNSNAETGYEIRRDGATGTLVASIGPNATSYTETGLQENTRYCYYVTALGPNGPSHYGGNPCDTTTAVAPTGLALTAPTAASFTLQWADNSAAEAGYKVWQYNGAGGLLLASLAPNATSYTVTGLQENTRYCFYVAALNAVGMLSYSGTPCATTLASAPVALTVGAPTAASLALQWDDTSAAETGFEIRRDGVVIKTLGPNTNAYTDTGLQEGRQYCYTVAARSAAGTSPSGSACATTLAAAPSGLTIAAPNIATLILQWADNSAAEAGYEVRRDSATGALVASLGPNATAYTDTGLTANTAYCYVVVARNAAGAASPAAACGTTLPTPPAAPALRFRTIGVSQTGSGESWSITLDWTDNATNEDAYDVARNGVTVATLGANGIQFTDTGLAPNTPYCYVVTARNAGGTGTSNQVCHTIGDLYIVPGSLVITQDRYLTVTATYTWCTGTYTMTRPMDNYLYANSTHAGTSNIQIRPRGTCWEDTASVTAGWFAQGAQYNFYVTVDGADVFKDEDSSNNTSVTVGPIQVR